ncbi:MAG TPA: polysaccharide deacetylase family protein, partial [Candidatus Binatus sp.]|nr:polysaccharide deacetylase family protein [Candidatus Binatus sp.]
MRPRSAVFVFHDIVPVGRLTDVPATHRPYALPPEEFRCFALAAATSARRAVPAGRVPDELGSLFYSLTFDDGHASDYTEAFPVLAELGLRATFFVVPTLVDTPGHVTWQQLREMVAGGMEIGSHSLTHPFVDRLDRAGLE